MTVTQWSALGRRLLASVRYWPGDVRIAADACLALARVTEAVDANTSDVQLGCVVRAIIEGGAKS